MSDIKTAVENAFEGADLEALRGYCDRLRIEYSKNHNATSLRKMLNAAMAEGSAHYSEALNSDVDIMSAEEKQDRARELVGLHLTAQAGWQGKRRLIILHRAMQHESTRPQFFAWGRLHCYVPMGTEVAIPYPIFNILKNTAGTRLVRKRRVDDEGRVYFQDQWVPTQRFMYSDLGDDPETANRPESMIDMVRELHGLTNGFDGYSLRQLREICRRLFLSEEEGWERIDFLAAIKAKCGLASARVDLGKADIAQAATG